MFELYLTESCGRTLMEDDACPGWNLSLSERDNCVQCGFKEAVMAGPAVPTLTLTPTPTLTLTLTLTPTPTLTWSLLSWAQARTLAPTLAPTRHRS